jgi:2-polyprenyl-3-methyl-5-hydroxy-6-metoxy-1,4-benzoquinol methylase
VCLKLKSLIANTLVKWFKALPIAGRFRFWCLYWAYKITGWHIRHEEWDFVLGYLPALARWQTVSLLDVGCARNLFCHEVVARRYLLSGVDIERPSFEYPGRFFSHDIRLLEQKDFIFPFFYDFITCISVLEHIQEGQSDAIRNMVNLLKVGGRILLTIPTHEFAQGHPWHGFSYQEIRDMLPENAKIRQYTERAGQLCLAIERVS